MTPAESFLAGHLATALALLETACEDGWTDELRAAAVQLFAAVRAEGAGDARAE